MGIEIGERMHPLLTIREAATLLNVHLSTLRRWEKTGLLEPYRVGPRGHRRYSREQINQLLSGRSTSMSVLLPTQPAEAV